MKWLVLGLGLLVGGALWSSAAPVTEASALPAPTAIGRRVGCATAPVPQSAQRLPPGPLAFEAVAWGQPGERPRRLLPPPWLTGGRRPRHSGGASPRRGRHRPARHRRPPRQAPPGTPDYQTAAATGGQGTPTTPFQGSGLGAVPVTGGSVAGPALLSGQAATATWRPGPTPSGAVSPAPAAAPEVGAAGTAALTPAASEGIPAAAAWAQAQWATAQLGDARLTRRAVQLGAALAAHPAPSLPQQLKQAAGLKGAYLLLNHPGVTLAQLATPHWRQTRAAAAAHPVVLLVQDTTELDYTQHPRMQGVGPIGNGKGHGLLLHSALAVVPTVTPQIVGLAHQQVVLRTPSSQRPPGAASPEGAVWAETAQAIGRPAAAVQWVAVGDRGSDDFRFMWTCQDTAKDFLIRVAHNRLLQWEQTDVDPQLRKLVDCARTLTAAHSYTLAVSAGPQRVARTAQMRLAWAAVRIPPPQQGPAELRTQPALTAWLVRTWEVDAPATVKEPLEWILVTSVPTTTLAQALERVRWYTCRWLVEDYHQCLKTGCAIEKRQFDHGDDIRRLLGFLGPLAARLLQLRNVARQAPDTPAASQVDPLMVQMLARRLQRPETSPMTVGDFWRGVARLGGHQGRRRDGPPGWKTIWRGWEYLSDLVTGARLYAGMQADQQMPERLSLPLQTIPVDWFP